MILDLQKASMWKRISAYMFDVIILAIVVIFAGYCLSSAMNYDDYNQTLNNSYDKYEAQYGIEFELTQEQYETLSPEKKENYDAAYTALVSDEQAMYAYNMLVNLTLVITSISILLGYALVEFLIPLLIGNGQTLGKKVFGIALMHPDCIKISTMQLFIRTFLGKYTIETMIPVLIIIMIFFNTLGLIGTLVLGLILLLQVILIIVTKTNSPIHDLLAGTVAVDISSQMIFPDGASLIAYKQKIHAEEVARQDY